MRILFVRHGKSVANAELTIATPDTPLAEEGVEQARETGRQLKTEHVTAIVCSPFLRARQTAEAIAKELGFPKENITIVDELGERRMGSLEGKPKRHESPFFFHNDTDYGFESHRAVIARLKTAVDKVREIAKHTGGTTVVVGHACSGFFFREIAKGHEHYKDFGTFEQMTNAAIAEIEYAKEKP